MLSTSNFNFMVLAFSAIILILNMIIVLILFLRTKKRERNGDISLDYPRELSEDKVYKAVDELTNSTNMFMDVNHLLLSSPSKNIILKQQVADYSFFEELGIDLGKIQIQRDTIMCLMPFHKRYDKVYAALQNACRMCGYKAIRSDNKFVPGEILKYTIELILKSQIIIAVIDGRNPNVFYEIGIAHSLGKIVVLVSNIADFQSVPFDLRNNRMVLYKGAKELEINLTECINSFNKEQDDHDTK